ncbi:uncharacterized protein DUF4352 [Sinobaca qinghaiensis]|uniref:Uncharacterized protein DUF4352 n=1 Tax=Sinobaca qinghaiensis TaxID=342944 RepID=A0A419V549_9BACL|nr:DUF4352 domain-containing protein [Sinobaca qinghaiensis]RKD73496.1 uncharacterized protein DUF4352 [Sinobaca qinghaiensis]
MKKFGIGCLGLIGILVIIVIIIVAVSGGDEASTSNEDGESSSENSSESDEEVYSMGEEAQAGDVTYVINNMETANSAGMEGIEQEANGIFIVLDVDVTNNGSEAVTMDSSYLSLLSNGNTYEADAANSDLFLEQINPDSSNSGEVVFDVNPDVAESDDLQAQLNEGMFGSNSAVVNLTE